MDIQVLTRSNAIPILFYLRSHPASSKTEIIRACTDATQKTTFVRVTELTEAGYVSDDGQTHAKNVQRISLTDNGMTVVSLLETIIHL